MGEPGAGLELARHKRLERPAKKRGVIPV